MKHFAEIVAIFSTILFAGISLFFFVNNRMELALGSFLIGMLWMIFGEVKSLEQKIEGGK